MFQEFIVFWYMIPCDGVLQTLSLPKRALRCGISTELNSHFTTDVWRAEPC